MKLLQNRPLKKVLFFIVLFITLVIVYHYTKPMYYVKNAEAKNIPYKIRPFRDSTYIYIPYKLTIYNNRLNTLKIYDIYHGKSYGNNSFGEYLLYNTDNLELVYLSTESEKLEEENYFDKHGDGAYRRISHTNIIKYQRRILPFFGRTFFYYKRHTLSNKNDRFKIKQLDNDEIKKQLYLQNYNLAVGIEESIIDSLYKINNNKRFNIHFVSEHLVTKKIRARINKEEQEAVYINMYDSIKGMNKKEGVDYLLKQAKKRNLKDIF